MIIYSICLFLTLLYLSICFGSLWLLSGWIKSYLINGFDLRRLVTRNLLIRLPLEFIFFYLLSKFGTSIFVGGSLVVYFILCVAYEIINGIYWLMSRFIFGVSSNP